MTFTSATVGSTATLDVSSCSIPILSGLYEDDGDPSINNYPMVAGTSNPPGGVALNSYTFTLQDGAQVSVIPAAVLGGTTNSYFNTYNFTIVSAPTSSTASTIPLYYASGSNYQTGTYTTINTAYPIAVNIPTSPPVANNVSASVGYDSSANTISPSVTGSYTSVAIATAPSHGTATVSGTSLVYTPTAGYDGTDSFTYTATNSIGTSAPATVSVTVGSPTITLSATSLTPGTVGSSYSVTLAPTGGASPYTFTTTPASGSLPPGLTLSSSGTISGTPTTTGTYSFTISGHDSSTPTQGTFTSGTLSIKISAQPPVVTSISPSTGPDVGGNSVTITGSNFTGATAVQFATTNATSFTINSPTQITATVPAESPGTGGDPNITVTTPAGTSSVTSADIYTYYSQPTFSSSTLPNGASGTPYSATLTASGGNGGPYIYKLSTISGQTGLPTGISFSSTSAGATFTGTPQTASGTYTFTLTVMDSVGDTNTAAYSIQINNDPVVISPTALPTTRVGSTYNTTITASGGSGSPYTWSVTGTLPPGISTSSNSTSLTFSGKPTAVGSYSLTVTAKDSSGISVSQAYSINVSASSVATLSNLTLSQGTLTPSFTSTTTSYSASVANTVSSITVTPTTTSSYATVTVNGTAVTSGSASQPIALAVGANTINVTVTAQDGTTVSGYTVTVNRTASSVATLSKLMLSQGTLTPTFASGTTSYASSVGHTVGSITVTPTTTDSTATVKVNGTTVTSGSASAPIALVVGSNKITVVVTAQNGTTTDTYTVDVNRASLLNPAKDPGVIALVTAQDQMAKQFANIQIDNFSNHLESLEGNQIPANDFGITLAPTNVAYSNPYGQAPGVPPQTQPGYMETVGAVPGAMGGYLEQTGGFENATAVTPQGRGRGRRVAAVTPARTTPATTTQHKFGFWTGGALEFQQGNSLDLHSNGLSGGIDVRVSRDAIVGFGLGIGEGKTDFTNNSNTNGNSTSEVFYGTVTPYRHAFVSFLAGHSSMRFTSERTVTGTTVVAHGQRNGQEFFGQIGGGMQYQTGQWLSVPYARVRMISGHLDAFDETASVATDALHYDRLSFSSTRFDLGLRSSFTRTYHFGTLTPQLRVEYDHQVQNQETQGLAYADLMNGPQYVLTLPQSGQNQGRVGLALGLHFTQGLRVSVEYQGIFGSSLQSDLLMAQVARNF